MQRHNFLPKIHRGVPESIPNKFPEYQNGAHLKVIPAWGLPGHGYLLCLVLNAFRVKEVIRNLI